MKENHNSGSKSWESQWTQCRVTANHIKMLQTKLLQRKLGMQFCSQLTMNSGMYTDVTALFKQHVNTQCEPQSSEGFAQFPCVGMEAECCAVLLVPAAPGCEGEPQQ